MEGGVHSLVIAMPAISQRVFAVVINSDPPSLSPSIGSYNGIFQVFLVFQVFHCPLIFPVTLKQNFTINGELKVISTFHPQPSTPGHFTSPLSLHSSHPFVSFNEPPFIHPHNTN